MHDIHDIADYNDALAGHSKTGRLVGYLAIGVLAAIVGFIGVVLTVNATPV